MPTNKIKKSNDSKPILYIYIYMTTQKRNIKERWATFKRIMHSYSCWNLQDNFNYYKNQTNKYIYIYIYIYNTTQ